MFPLFQSLSLNTNGARIFAGAKVIDNIIIGRNAIIEANGVAVKDIPENEVWGGVLAHEIGLKSHPLSS